MSKTKVETMAVAHGLDLGWWDAASHGYRLRCLCGFETDAWETVEGVGAAMDDHFADVKTMAGKKAPRGQSL